MPPTDPDVYDVIVVDGGKRTVRASFALLDLAVRAALLLRDESKDVSIECNGVSVWRADEP